MSTEREAILVYGWVGTEDSVGEILKGFADKHSIEEDVGDLCYEISESYSHHFMTVAKKHTKGLKFEIDLVSGQDGYEGGSRYFGFKIDHIYNTDFEDLAKIVSSLNEAYKEIFNGLELEKPTLSTVIYWY